MGGYSPLKWIIFAFAAAATLIALIADFSKTSALGLAVMAALIGLDAYLIEEIKRLEAKRFLHGYQIKLMGDKEKICIVLWAAATLGEILLGCALLWLAVGGS